MVCAYVCVCAFLVLFFWFLCLISPCYLKEGKKKAWSWIGRRVGKIWEKIRRGKLIRIYWMKIFIFNLKIKLFSCHPGGSAVLH